MTNIQRKPPYSVGRPASSGSVSPDIDPAVYAPAVAIERSLLQQIKAAVEIGEHDHAVYLQTELDEVYNRWGVSPCAGSS